jgi:hypothetical protein
MKTKQTINSQPTQNHLNRQTHTPEMTDERAVDAALQHGIHSPTNVMALQRTIGNQATAQLLGRRSAQPVANRIARASLAHHTIQRNDKSFKMPKTKMPKSEGFDWKTPFSNFASFTGAGVGATRMMIPRLIKGVPKGGAMGMAPLLLGGLGMGINALNAWNDPSGENLMNLGLSGAGMMNPVVSLGSDMYSTGKMFKEDK